ncbi:hypothetical protein [Cryobacterium sp. Y82]|uniref:hypothetical protein n=1 Tax=Cryobacterium sp. Y82 TaxID=2045017 RepID=UPI000CE41365|nr:hypothetical protein [Cryobacterium sp. Y82]
MALTIAAVLAFGTLFAAPASANRGDTGPVTIEGNPFIIGDPIIGKTLTLDVGTWDHGTTFTYQWRYASGEPIEGATSSSFAPTEAQRWDHIYVAVTGTLSDTSEVAASAFVRVERPPMSEGSVSVSGSAVVGSVLTVTAGNDWPEGAKLAYFWGWSNGETGDGIDGVTGTTFTVPATQVGRQIVAGIVATLDGVEDARVSAHTDFVTAATIPVATVPVEQAPTTPVATVPAAQAPAAAAPVATSAELAAFLTAARVETRTAASAGLPATGLDVTKPYTATVDWAAADGFVDVYAYSTPTLVGTFPVINGKVQVVLSSAMLSALAAGSHTLVVSGQSSGAVQAVAFNITKTLAATGVDPIVPIGSAALLLLLGAALIVVRRRRTLA